MASPVFAYASKLARKFVMAVLIAVMTLLAYSLWLFVEERGDYLDHRKLRMERVETRHAEAKRELADATTRARVAAEALTTQQQRLAQADKVLKSLHELDPSALERLLGDREQQAAHDERIARTARIRTETETRIVDLQAELAAVAQKRIELEGEVARLGLESEALHAEKGAASHYLRTAWNEGAWAVYTVFFVYLFGGLAVALLLYYGWAQLMAGKSPMRLRKGEAPAPTFGESGTLSEHMLWPGERLWVRKRFLQSADTALTRKKRLLPDWRRPLSWWLSGNSGLTELRNERSDGERQVVFANMNDPFAELVVVSVPEGGSFIVRAGHVMGLISDIGRAPVITRHWRFGSWYSWVAGRFGFFEFYGPCRLVVSCVNAVTDETLSSPDEKNPASACVPVAGLVGFTPQLSLVPVRTGSFWRYCRRATPLFELKLSGTGAYLVREADSRGSDRFKARIWKRLGL